MKLSRKLIPAFAMLLVSAIMLTTASYAWFSINDSVTAEGMNVRTTAADNVLIAKSTLGKTAEEDDANFGTTLVVNDLEAILNPVSTINGTSFFYTEGTNVKGDGSVKEKDYEVYTDSSFVSAGAVGYVDYIFQVKVINAQAETQRVILNELTLTYGKTYATDSERAQKAFRVAVFAERLGGGAFTDGVGALKTIQYLVDNGAKVILCSHMGRPHNVLNEKLVLSKKDKKKIAELPENEQEAAAAAMLEKAKGDVTKLSLAPVAKKLSELLGQEVIMRAIPELHFELDDSIEYSVHINQLLRSISTENKEEE